MPSNARASHIPSTILGNVLPSRDDADGLCRSRQCACLYRFCMRLKKKKNMKKTRILEKMATDWFTGERCKEKSIVFASNLLGFGVICDGSSSRIAVPEIAIFDVLCLSSS